MEECIGLDVAGTAAVDRLGLQAVPMQVYELAAGLGIRRFNVISQQVLLENEEIVIEGKDGHRLYCLTSLLQDIRPILNE